MTKSENCVSQVAKNSACTVKHGIEIHNLSYCNALGRKLSAAFESEYPNPIFRPNPSTNVNRARGMTRQHQTRLFLDHFMMSSALRRTLHVKRTSHSESRLAAAIFSAPRHANDANYSAARIFGAGCMKLTYIYRVAPKIGTFSYAL